MLPKINRTSFLHECVPAIFIVPENTANSSSPPKIFPFRRFDALLGQRGGNFCGGCTFQTAFVDAIERLDGIHCGMKETSCPDQLATALKQAREKLAENA